MKILRTILPLLNLPSICAKKLETQLTRFVSTGSWFNFHPMRGTLIVKSGRVKKQAAFISLHVDRWQKWHVQWLSGDVLHCGGMTGSSFPWNSCTTGFSKASNDFSWLVPSVWQFSELTSLHKKLDNFLYKISSYLKYLKQFAFQIKDSLTYQHR